MKVKFFPVIFHENGTQTTCVSQNSLKEAEELLNAELKEGDHGEVTIRYTVAKEA